MITLKPIISQLCPGDWFMSLDLKDAYFHIEVVPHHKLFLRFAFKGVKDTPTKTLLISHNPPHPRTVPPWDLPTVLKALKGPPFEPLQSTSPRALSLKTALLLALPSVKREGDLQALSINPACLEFGPNDSKVVLKPRLGYVPRCSRLRSVPRNPCSAPSGP